MANEQATSSACCGAKVDTVLGESWACLNCNRPCELAVHKLLSDEWNKAVLEKFGPSFWDTLEGKTITNHIRKLEAERDKYRTRSEVAEEQSTGFHEENVKLKEREKKLVEALREIQDGTALPGWTGQNAERVSRNVLSFLNLQ